MLNSIFLLESYLNIKEMTKRQTVGVWQFQYQISTDQLLQ